MKANKKIILAVGSVMTAASLVGSIAGSVAWYQYSTRATMSYTGTSVHNSENIQISLDKTNWKGDLSISDINTYLTTTLGRDGTGLRPVTTSEQAKDEKLNTLYKNPIYQYNEINQWGKASVDKDYITIPLYFRVLDVNGASSSRFIAKDIYLSDVTMVEKVTSGKKDISNALRVQIHTDTQNRLISKQGNSVETHGKLDLNGDGLNDKSVGYEWETTHELDYGMTPTNGSVADNAHLPATPHDGDVYYVEDAGVYKKYNETNTSWEEYSPVAESYSNTDAEAISDDSDPLNITGAPRLGTTDNAVNALADLPVINEVRKNNGDNKNYKFNGTAWVETSDATTKGAVSSLAELITPAVNDVFYANDTANQYKWTGTAWVVNADEQVAALPDDLASIGDSYHNTDSDLDVIWDGSAWVEGGDGALGDKTTAELADLVVALDHSYELTTDHKIYLWSGDGNNFNLKELLFRVDVTIYLEGWHPFATKGDVASKTALEANYLATNDSYHVTDLDKNYTFDGTKWVLGGDGAKGNVATFKDLRMPTDTFHALDDDKIYIYDGSAWVENSGSAIWDDSMYVGAQFNIGLRFTSEAHTDH